MLFRALILIGLSCAMPAWAMESAPVSSARATVTLISDADVIRPGTPFRIALHQRLSPGWHTYWSNPGDAGQPPDLALTLPEGSSAGPLTFPAPHRLPFGPLVNFGYEKQATFTMEVTPPANLQIGDRFSIGAEATWLVCEKICIPEEGRFQLDIPVGAEVRTSPQMALFIAAEADQARPSPFTARIGFEEGRGVLEIAGDVIGPNSVRDAFFFPAEWGLLDHAAPQPLNLRAGSFTLGLTRGQADVPASVAGIVTITDGAGVRSAYSLSAAPGPMPSVGSDLPLWQAMLWAAIGGLILNLMPCVFPILAMKALALARLGGAERQTVRLHSAAYTAGVVLSFVALAGLLSVLKTAGLAAGWGFQFTAPAFVAAMAWLMLAIGLNMSGVFGIGATVSVGGTLAAKGGTFGAFATGILAVLVATPCTAPFMAAAIGAALTMPAMATLAVFAAMGVGMALPYALLGLFPRLAALLPRPGPWMERTRQALAFPMYAAAAWLVWVLSTQSGADGVLLGLAGGVLVAFAAWLVGQAQGAGRGGARFGHALAGLAIIAAVALLPRLSISIGDGSASAQADAERWSKERVLALQSEGRPVFVNLTAAWCISCKVNERFIRGETVQAAFQAARMAYLVGDLTRGDPLISVLLRDHGREGVPLYLLYPAGGGAPAILPQILTEGILLQYLSAATS
jgi:thiol:disulfide interchange protein/DsbC/DsbD-like thiol-disulfide interchange protein